MAAGPRSEKLPRGSVVSEPGAARPPGLVYLLCWELLYIACRTLFDLKVVRPNNCPAQGGLIIASNHQSFLDPVFLAVAGKRPLAFMARGSLFETPGLALLIQALNAFPVSRHGSSPASLRRCLRRLRRGWAVVVFPEGTRTPDGNIQPLRQGLALLAERSGVPVLPARISGAFRAWPRTRLLPRPGRIRVALGRLLLYNKEFETYGTFTARVSKALDSLPGEGFKTARL